MNDTLDDGQANGLEAIHALGSLVVLHMSGAVEPTLEQDQQWLSMSLQVKAGDEYSEARADYFLSCERAAQRLQAAGLLDSRPSDELSLYPGCGRRS